MILWLLPSPWTHNMHENYEYISTNESKFIRDFDLNMIPYAHDHAK